MAIRVAEDVRVDGVPEVTGHEEDIWLPGPKEGDEDEGPFPFVCPSVQALRRSMRKASRLPAEQAETASQDAMDRWLSKGFGPEAWEHIEARLDDDDDQLHEGHLQWMFQQIIKESTGRPTTSSNAASRPPWKKPSTAAPSQPESTSTD